VNLRLAVNRRFKDRNGELKDDTCFITVTAWDKQAEVCNQYLQKGRPVFIEGRLQTRSWETSDGQKRNVVEVRAERIQFLGSRPNVEKQTEPLMDEPPKETDNAQGDNTDWSGQTNG
jgi:single-strand DNA-binding protein